MVQNGGGWPGCSWYYIDGGIFTSVDLVLAGWRHGTKRGRLAGV